MLLATEHVWHYWIAIVMVLMSVFALLTIVGLYVARVSKTRFSNSDS